MEDGSRPEHPNKNSDTNDKIYDDNLVMFYRDVAEIALKRFERAQEDKREMDNKAAILLAANGVLIGFVATAWTNLNPYIGSIAMIFMLWSIFECSWALIVRPYGDLVPAPSPEMDVRTKDSNGSKEPEGPNRVQIITFYMDYQKRMDRYTRDSYLPHIKEISKHYAEAIKPFLVAVIFFIVALLLHTMGA